MDEKLREILRQHRFHVVFKELEVGPQICSCLKRGDKDSEIYLPALLDQWIAHIEQLERAQPATPVCDHFWSEGDKAFGCVLPKGHGGDHSAFAQPSVAAQGTDGLRQKIADILADYVWPIGRIPNCVEKIITLLASHDAEKFLRSRWRGDLSAIPLGKVVEFMQSFSEKESIALRASVRLEFQDEIQDLNERLRSVREETLKKAAHWLRSQGGMMGRLYATELVAALAHTEKASQPQSPILAAQLYRSLERLSLAIESCAKIGFEESSPTENAYHASVWNDLNEAQKDAKLKLKHFARAAQQTEGKTAMSHKTWRKPTSS